MPFFKPLLAILVGLSAVAGVGSRLAQESSPGPATGRSCATPQAQCRYGYVMDPNTGCPTDVCAPRAPGAAEVQESPQAQPPSQPNGEVPSKEDGYQGGDQGQGDERCKADMLRNLTRWEKDLFRGFDQQMRNLRSNKVQIPAELTAAVNGLHQQFAAAKSAGSCQEMNDANNAINDAVQPLMEQIQALEQAANDARCVKDSLRGIKDLERQPLKDMDRKIKALERQKIAPPADIVTTLAKIRELIAQAKQATTCQDASEASQEVFEAWNEIQEKFMILDFLAQAPRMIKQIEREMRSVNQQWARAVRQARANKTDLSDLIAKGDAIIAELKAMFDEFKALISSGDVERMQAMEGRGQDAELKRDDLFQIIQTVQALANAPREIRRIENRITFLRRTSKQLGRKNDVAELDACIESLAASNAAVKSVAALRPIDVDRLIDAFQTVEDDLGKCDDILEDLQGKRGVFEDAFGGFPGGGGLNGGPPRETMKPLEAPVP